MTKLLILLIALLILPLLLLNIRATRYALGSEIFDGRQKKRQILLIWLIPFIGAIITREAHFPTEIRKKSDWVNGDHIGVDQHNAHGADFGGAEH